VRWPHLAVPTAPIDERDIAAVAVRALREDGRAGAEYVLTGPQSLSQFEQMSTIGRVIGRSLRIKEISPDEARRELLTIMPAPAIICCSTPGLRQAVYQHSSHPRSQRLKERRQGHFSSGLPITLRSFERDLDSRTRARTRPMRVDDQAAFDTLLRS
jgi:hypothetical protein